VTMWVSLEKLYENLDTLGPTDSSLSLNFNDGFE